MTILNLKFYKKVCKVKLSKYFLKNTGCNIPFQRYFNEKAISGYYHINILKHNKIMTI